MDAPRCPWSSRPASGRRARVSSPSWTRSAFPGSAWAGRPRGLPDSVGADKAYSNSLIRSYLRRRGIRHVIPERNDSKAARWHRGSDGGRPPGFDKTRYKARNTVERAINKIKQFRAVATRYDKRGYVFLGTVTVAPLLIWLRS